MRPHLRLQQRDQLRLHEGVVVGDVEADDAGVLQVRPEAALEFGAVGALHDEDDIGPVQQLRRDRLVRVGGQAGGGRLHARPVGEDLLGGGGAEAVAGADEEEVGQERQRLISWFFSPCRIGWKRQEIQMSAYQSELQNVLPEAAEMSFDCGQGSTPQRVIVLADVLFGRARQTLSDHTAFYEITYAEIALTAASKNYATESRFGDTVSPNRLSSSVTRTQLEERNTEGELGLSGSIMNPMKSLSAAAKVKKGLKTAATLQSSESHEKQRVQPKGNLKWDVSEFDTEKPLRGRYIGDEPLCTMTSDEEIEEITLRVLVPKRNFHLHSVTENNSGEIKALNRAKQKVLEILSSRSIAKDGDALIICEGRMRKNVSV